MPPLGCGIEVGCGDPRCAGSEACSSACPPGSTFASIGCRLDAFQSRVGGAVELGNGRGRLGDLLGRARLSVDTAEQRCGAAARRPARGSLRKAAKRLAAVRRNLRAAARRGLVPAGVVNPLIGTAGELRDDTKVLRAALQCG